MERAGYVGKFRCFEAPSYEILPQLLKNNERVDFIFIDGNHRFEFTLIDFFCADRMLDLGGRLVFHDPWLPAIRKVMSFVCRNRRDNYAIEEEYCGAARRGLAYWKALLKGLKENPFDILADRYYAMRPYPNYCVLKKVGEHPPEFFDNAWNYYQSF